MKVLPKLTTFAIYYTISKDSVQSLLASVSSILPDAIEMGSGSVMSRKHRGTSHNPLFWLFGLAALLPHERGQIAHVVSTLEGTRKFSDSDDPPPAEWLCVFDPSIRYSKPGNLFSTGEKESFFDPFDAYGLEKGLFTKEEFLEMVNRESNYPLPAKA
jgi:hypothetical protein